MMSVRTLRALRCVAAVCALVLLAGCEPNAAEIAHEREAAQKVALAALEEDEVWVGKVTGYDGLYDDLLLLDYGGDYPARIDLAHIIQLDECPSEEQEESEESYSKYLQKAVPIGSRIRVARSQNIDGTYDDDRGMVYKLKPDGTANAKSRSLNEMMAAAGVADPDPFVIEDAVEGEEPIAQTIADQKKLMSVLDFGAWRKVLASYRSAFKRKVGPLGKCITQALNLKKKEQRASEASDREFRRWELGPDGRKGTIDDYTDGKSRNNGGGGSFNVPGRLCPTRFC